MLLAQKNNRQSHILSSQIIFLVSAGCIFGGAVLGLLLSGLLPEGHLRDKSKDTVKVVTGMIATLAALVLGLLISSAQPVDAGNCWSNCTTTKAGCSGVCVNR